MEGEINKEQKCGIIISVCLIICSYIVYKIRLNESYHISKLLNKLSSGMQIKQIAASYFIFLVGYWSIMHTGIQWNFWRRITFAYILGTAIWGVMSVLYLCIGIKYNLLHMMFGLSIIEIILYFVGKKRLKHNRLSFVCDSVIFMGIVAFASTGLMNISYGTGDTQYFIQQWGKGIAILGEINETQHAFLTHTGLLPATFSSLAYFFGADNVYTIHHCLEICFWIFFGITIETDVVLHKTCENNKKRFLSIGLTILVFMLPPVRVLSGWIISNTYLMVYMFVICRSLYVMLEKKETEYGQQIFTIIIAMATTLLRADSSITICIIIGCFAICYMNEVKSLWLFLVAAFFPFAIYYMKLSFMLGEKINGVTISTTTLLLMLACFILVGGYMAIAKYIEKRMSPKIVYRMLLVALLFLNVMLLLIFQNIYLENLNIIFKNTIVVDWFWGSTLPIVAVGMIYTISKGEYDVFWLLEVCMIVIFIDLGVLRTINGKVGVARLGVGDSINRSIISVLPIFFYNFYLKLFQNMQFSSSKQGG